VSFIERLVSELERLGVEYVVKKDAHVEVAAHGAGGLPYQAAQRMTTSLSATSDGTGMRSSNQMTKL
jgi:hypothetical protein